MTTAGNDEKVQICRKLGANVVVNYKTGNVEDALNRSATSTFGGRTSANRTSSGRSATWPSADGSSSWPAGMPSPPFPIGPFYTRDARMYGFAMFNSPAEEQRKAAAEINRWLARGKFARRSIAS